MGSGIHLTEGAVDQPGVRHHYRLAGLLMAYLVVSAATVFAGPTGGKVVAGDGNISDPNPTTTLIHQLSNRMVIDWTSFNLAPNETVQFIQPSISAAALNRILGQDPSEIFGNIIANGQVYLLNPNGIVFSKTAEVNVGGLFATGLNITNDDFMSGNLKFAAPTGQDGGYIINHGVLKAATGGSINLIGSSVFNDGIIIANLGQVNMVGGSAVTVDFNGDGLMQFQINGAVLHKMVDAESGAVVTNAGTIEAHGGTVVMTASVAEQVLMQAVNNSGIIQASAIQSKNGHIYLTGVGENDNEQHIVPRNNPLANSFQNNTATQAQGIQNQAGHIYLTGTGGDVINSGTLEADNSQGDGGTVNLQSNADIFVDGNSIISAQSSKNGKGGTVELLGNRVAVMDDAAVNVSGDFGGGTILVGGDYHGGNGIQQAADTVLAPDAILIANALASGNGGKVILWSTDYTGFYGVISVKGGISSGNGGFVETSSHADLQVTGQVNALSPAGQGGTWLLDPSDINITNAGITAGTFSGSPTSIFTPNNATPDNVNVNSIISAFGAGVTTVIVDTASAAAGAGTISVQTPIAITNNSGAAETLVLSAYNAINFNGSALNTITGSGTDPLNVTLWGNNLNAQTNPALSGTYTAGSNAAATIAVTSAITTNGGNLTIESDNNAITVSAAINTGGGSFSSTGLTFNNTGGVISTSGGNVTLNQTGAVTIGSAIGTGGGSFSSTGTTFNNTGGSINTSNGLLTLNQTGAVTIGDFLGSGTGMMSIVGVGITEGAFGMLVQSAGAGTVILSAGAGVITLNNVGNDLTGAVTLTNSGANAVTLNNGANALTIGNGTSVGNNLTLTSGALSFGSTMVGGALSVTSSGAITQTGALIVVGTTTLAAGAGNNITLNNAANAFTGAVGITSGNNVILVDNIATALAASTVSGTLTVTSNGAITQTGALVVTGASSFNAGANAITLNNGGNNFTGAVTLTNSGANNVTLSNGAHALTIGSGTNVGSDLTLTSGALSFGTTTVGGNLSATTTGAITQTGALTVAGTSAFGTGAFAITLNNAGNNFSGAVTLNNTGANAVILNNGANALTIGNGTSVGGNLTLTSGALSFGTTTVGGALIATANGAITQTGALTVTGATTLAAGAGNNITLLNLGNAFTGAVGITSANNVILINSKATALGLSTVSGTLAVTSNGAITQTAALTVTGTSSFSAGASAITLNNAGNNFTGAVTLTNSGANNVTLNNGANLLTLGTVSVGSGTLTLTSVGITEGAAGTITQAAGAGAVTIAAGAGVINLGNANNFTGAVTLTNSGANNVTLNNGANLLTLGGASSIGTGTLTLTSLGITEAPAGTITQAAGAGAVSINAGAGIIALGNANHFTGAVTLTNSGANNVTLNNGANLLTLGTVSVGSGTLTLTSVGITEGAAGTITQAAGAGAVTIAAGAGVINLGNANNFTGAVTLTNSGANNVTLNNGANLLTLGGASSIGTGTLTLTSLGITEAPAGTITQAAGAGAVSINAGAGIIALGNANHFTGAVTLTNSGANTATLSNGANALTIGSGTNVGSDLTLTSGALSFGTTTVGGNLSATTTGAITQTGALTVAGTSAFGTGAFAITLNNAGNNFGGAVTLNNTGANAVILNNGANALTIGNGTSVGNNLTLTSGALSFGTTTVGGALVATANGAITQTGALTVTGATTLAAGAGNNITLDNAANAFTGAVGITSGNNVVLVNNIATALAASTVSGTLNVQTNGALTQTGVLTVAGAATFQQNSLIAGATQNITLNTQANNFANTVTFTTGAGAGINNLLWRNTSATPGALFLPASITGNLTLTYNNAAITLPGIAIGGALTVTANGAITQSGALTVAGTSTLAAGAANNITLNNAGNAFTGAVGITTGNAVTLVNSIATALAASTVSGALTVTSNGAITQTGALTVTDITTLAAGAANNITLNNAANAFTGAVGITSGNNVTLINNRATVLGASTISGTFNVQTNGALTQTGVLTVAGAATFQQNSLIAGATQNITLNTQANNFANTVTFTTGAGAGINNLLWRNTSATPGALFLPASITGNLTLTYDNAAITLPGIAIGGALTVTSNGAITQTGALTVTGATTLAAGAGNNITLDNAANAFTGAVGITSGNNVVLVNNIATALAASTVSGTLNVQTNGALTQTGVLTVAGAATFQQNSLIAGATQNITLNTQANNFANTVTFTTGAGAGINNLLWRNTSATPGALFLPASITGNLTLTYNNAAITLPGIAIGGALTVTANGAITQSGALTVAGTSTLAAGAANNITLNDPGNDFIGAVGITNGDNVSLTDVNSIILAASNVSGILNINAAGSVTETGAITANTLTGTLTGAASAFILNTFNNNITNLGISSGAGITAPGGFFLTNGNNNVNVNGVITTTNSPITISAGTGAFQMLSATSAFITGSGAITTFSDQIGISSTVAAGAFQTTGAVTLQPFSAGTTMSLAGGGGTFNLILSEIAEAVAGITGAGSITIGTAGVSTGLMTIAGPVNFGSITASIYAGSITDGGNIRVITAKNLNLTANNAGGAIGAAGGNNPIDVSVTNLTVNTNNGNAFITSTGGFNLGIGATASNVGSGQLNLNVTTGGTITQTTSITANTLTATLVGAGSALNLNGVVNNITNLGTAATGITAPGGFALTDGNTPLNVINAVSTAGGTGISITAGSITESGGGLINTTGILTTGTLTGQTLNGANTIGTFNATNTTGGNIALTNTANPLIITGVANAGGGSVTINNTGALSITGAITAGGGGAVNLTASGAAGAITESGGGLINTNGLTTLTGNAGNDITLGGANDFGSVTVASGRNVVLNDINALQFSGASVVSGTLSVTAIGITEAVGGSLSVTSSSTLNAGAGVITLGNANAFTGAVTLINSGNNNVTLNNGANLLTLGGASSVGTGTLTLTSSGITEGGAGTITQAVGAGAVTINAGAGVIALGNANNFTGTVSLSNSGAFAATLSNIGDLTLGTVNVGGALIASSTTGSLTLNGAITAIGGNSTFNAATNMAVNAGINASGNNVALNIGTSGAGGNLTFGSINIAANTLLIAGGNGNDTFNLNGLTTTAVSFTVNGGSGNNTLIGNNSGDAFNITSPDAGNITGLVTSFTNIQNLIGGTGNDTFTLASGVLTFNGSINGGGGVNTLVATDGSNTWAITGMNAGTLNATTVFSGISNLTGGTGDDDFVFSDGQGVTGTVDGGAGGNNTLDFSAYSTAVGITLNGSNAFGYSGTTSGSPNPTGGFADITQIDEPALSNILTLANGIATTVTINSSAAVNLFNLTVNVSGAPNLVFTNIGTVNGGTGVINTLISGEGTNNIWTLTSANGGTYNDGQLLIFTNFADLVGGSGNDSFVLAGGSVTNINGGAGNNTLTGDNSGDTFDITGANAGTVTGLVTGFTHIQNLVGGSGDDSFVLAGGSVTNINGGAGNNTLTGDNSGDTFDITGANAGAVTGLVTSFTHIQNLVGGSGNDTFTLASGVVSFNGSITGGGGIDTLAATDGSNAWQITGANAGTLNTTTVFSGITNLMGGSGTDTLTGVAGGSNWNITGANAVSVSGMNGTSMEALVGGAGNDTFTLASGVVSFNGSITGGGGIDTLAATDGSNAWQITGANAGTLNTTTVFSGITNLMGGSGTDTLTGVAGGSNWNITGANAVSVSGMNGTSMEALVGGAGNDTFTLASGVVSFNGSITGGGGIDTLAATDGSNAWQITGANAGTLNATTVFSGISNLTGGSGNDTFTLSGTGNISGLIIGGGGIDTLVGNNLVNSWLLTGANAGSLTDTHGSNAFSGIANLIGGSSNDTFTLASGVLTFNGSINGGGGVNTLVATDGSNTWAITGMNAGTLNATTVFSGISNLTGGTGDDDFVFSDGQGVTGTVDGGAGGNNTLDFSAYSTAVGITLNGSNAFGYSGTTSGSPNPTGGFADITQIDEPALSNILTLANGIATTVTINSSAAVNLFNLTVNVSGAPNLVFTNIGTVNGGTGVINTLISGEGTNNIWTLTSANGGTYNDGQLLIFTNFADLVGGSGNDSFVLAGGSVTNINGGAGNNTLTGDNSGDTFDITGANAGTVTGLVTGFTHIQNLVGGSGDDSFVLAGGSVTNINGGAGNNTLTGDNSGDTFDITGANAGAVTGLVTSFTHIQNLTGGSGNDNFVFFAGGSVGGNLIGGGGTNTLDYSNLATPVNVVLASVSGGVGAGTGSLIGGNFTGISILKGSASGADVLTGPNQANVWQITGANAGTVDGFQFSSIENLTGGNSTDQFILNGGSLSGNVNGGSGNAAGNSLQGNNGTNLWNITGVNQGTVTGIGGSFTNIGNLIGGNGVDTFVFSNGASLSGSLDGGGTISGNDTIDWSAYITARNVTITGAGAIDGMQGTESSIAGGFNNITDIIGASGVAGLFNRITGPNIANTWNVSSSNGGNLDSALNFSNFQILTGGNAADTFNLSAGVSGSINGGGGNDIVNVISSFIAPAATLTINNVETINDNAAATITAITLAISGATSIGSASKPLLTDISALQISGSNGNAFIDTLGNVDLQGIDVGAGVFTLVSGGSVTDATGQNVTAAGVTINAISGIGTSSAPINTGTGSLSAAVSGVGGIYASNTGAITLGNITTTNGSIDITSSGDLTTAGIVSANGSGDVTLNADGILNLDSTISSAAGTLSLTGDAGVTGNSNGSLSGTVVNIAAASGNILFVGVTSGAAGGTTLLASGNVTLQGFTTTKGALTILNGGTFAVTAPVLLSGALNQTGAGPVSLSSSITSNGGNVQFASPVTVNGIAAITTNGGNILFNDNITGTGTSSSLTLNSGAGNIGLQAVSDLGTLGLQTSGTLSLGGDISTNDFLAGGVTGGVVIAGSSIHIDTANSDVDFSHATGINGVTAGGQALTINTGTGNVNLSQVGQTTTLASLTISGGTITLADVTTTKVQSYTGNVQLHGNLSSTVGGGIQFNGNLLLLSNAVISAGGAGNIIVSGAVDGAHALTLTAASGQISLNGIVGGNTALTSLTLNSAVANIKSVTTFGDQAYNAGTTNLAGVLNSKNGAINFSGVLGITTDSTIQADTIGFNGGASSVRGNSTLVLLPETYGLNVNIGGSGSGLILNNAAMDGYDGYLYIGTGPGPAGTPYYITEPVAVFAGNVIVNGSLTLGSSGKLLLAGLGNLVLNGGTLMANTITLIAGSQNSVIQNPGGSQTLIKANRIILVSGGQIGALGQELNIATIGSNPQVQIATGAIQIFLSPPTLPYLIGSPAVIADDIATQLGLFYQANSVVTSIGQQIAALAENSGLLESGFVDVSLFQNISLYDIYGLGISLPVDQCERLDSQSCNQ